MRVLEELAVVEVRLVEDHLLQWLLALVGRLVSLMQQMLPQEQQRREEEKGQKQKQQCKVSCL